MFKGLLFPHLLVKPPASPPADIQPPPQPLKLSIVTQFYPPDFAATGQFVADLAEQLAEQQVEVQVFTGQPGYAFDAAAAPETEMKGKVLIQRSRVSQWGSRKLMGRTVRSILFCARTALHLLNPANRGDVLLLTSEPPFLHILGYLIHLFLGVRYACLIYDLYPEVAIELKVLSEQHWLVKFWHAINRRVWNRAESIIVPSETMRDRIVARVPDVADKITVIHNWADPSWIKPVEKQQNPFAQTHDLVEKFTVLYSGNMGRCHDMDTILAAAAELRHDPVQFVFIGAGPKREACIQQAETLGLTNCTFLPYQDRHLLPQSLTACDLSLVSIDIGMEGLVAPSKFYSALSSGRPVAVICEPHSYLRQLVADANCGAAFVNGDSQGLAAFIRYLAKDPHMAQRFGLAGHQYIQEHFTPRHVSQQYFNVLQRVVLKDAELERAIAQEEFQIYYQPIVSLTTGEIQEVEALLRWQHPQRGLLNPIEFLANTEVSGLDVLLGWWLLNQACRQLRIWLDQMPQTSKLRVSLNLSKQQFLQPDLIPQLDRILQQHQLTGNFLCLEVQEQVLIENAAAATAILPQLQARQVHVCVDNFGSGYTSLNFLHRFPIDRLKIDRSLIQKLDHDPNSAKLVQSLLTISQQLGIHMTVIGVETAAQLQSLKTLGVSAAQGYLFSRPMNADKILPLLQRHYAQQPDSVLIPAHAA